MELEQHVQFLMDQMNQMQQEHAQILEDHKRLEGNNE